MLKTDLHIHTKEDKHDIIEYPAKKYIDKAAALKFDVLSFTHHSQLFWNKEIVNYAKKKGILLIPGIELVIEGKDVLIYNITLKQIKTIKTFDDLRKLRKKNKNIFVIAPHPYFKTKICLGKTLEDNIDLFDAIEHSWFYTKLINFNKKAKKIAEKYKKTFIATSDAHYLKYFGLNYCFIDATKEKKAIFTAIKNNKIKNSTKPRTLALFILIGFKIITEGLPLITKNNKYRRNLETKRCQNLK